MTRTLADSGGALLLLGVLCVVPASMGATAPAGALVFALVGVLLAQLVPARPLPSRADFFFRGRVADRPLFVRQLLDEIRRHRKRVPMLLACTPLLLLLTIVLGVSVQHPLPEAGFPLLPLWVFDFLHCVFVAWGVQLLQVRHAILQADRAPAPG